MYGILITPLLRFRESPYVAWKVMQTGSRTTPPLAIHVFVVSEDPFSSYFSLMVTLKFCTTVSFCLPDLGSPRLARPEMEFISFVVVMAEALPPSPSFLILPLVVLAFSRRLLPQSKPRPPLALFIGLSIGPLLCTKVYQSVVVQSFPSLCTGFSPSTPPSIALPLPF